MVANDPGDWFEESLQAIVASDYPNFSVIIVDNGSRVTLAQRVGASLPNALFLRNETNLGFSAAVDAAVRNVTSATYLMICHDDAAVAPDAISIMVEDA
ncbi:glycosyltransferase, partial [mine drainage metagenome]